MRVYPAVRPSIPGLAGSADPAWLVLFAHSLATGAPLGRCIMSEIAVLTTAHPQRPDVIKDTVDAILYYVTDKILCVVDGIAWEDYQNVHLPCAKLEGFRYGCPRAPYRNVALGLSVLIQ